MENWILVADTQVCDLSKKQIEVCKNLDVPIQGAVLCNEKNNENTPICHQVDFFPTFCHVNSNICIPGIRKTKEDFDTLEKVLETELRKK